MSTSAISPIVGPPIVGMAPHREQQLMLGRGQSAAAACFLTPVQEPAQLRTNPQQLAILRVTNRPGHHAIVPAPDPVGCVRTEAA